MPCRSFVPPRSSPDALKLRLTPLATEEPDHEWFADLFYVERRKCVLWTHRTTLLTFARPAVLTTELRGFHGLFRSECWTLLASLGFAEDLIDRLGIDLPASFAPTNDRAILGSMLDYRRMFESMVDYKGGLAVANIAGINAELNQSPMSVLGMESAVYVARKLLASSPILH